MSTILDFVHSATASHSEECLPSGLSADMQATLRRIEQREVEILFPLTNAVRIEEVRHFAEAGEIEYRQLVEQWHTAFQDVGILPSAPAESEGEAPLDGQWIRLPDDTDNERWQGALESEAAFVAWIEAHGASTSDDEEKQQSLPLQDIFGPFMRFQMAKRAILLAVASPLGVNPQTVSALAEFADDCMTEVEDAFLANADYGEDDGERVSLEDLRANLGL